jgi:hypothetical protein
LENAEYYPSGNPLSSSEDKMFVGTKFGSDVPWHTVMNQPEDARKFRALD